LSVSIVTDSTADVPPAMAADLGITVIPLTVFFGEAAYRDGVDVDADRFFELLERAEHHPRTSAPAVGDFQTAYEKLAAEGEVLSIHISSKLSGTLNSAYAAAQAVGSSRVAVVDSQTASLGLGLAVIAAAGAAQAGAKLDECRQAAQEALDRQRIYFTLDTLEFLRRGGRIGRAQALLGGILNIKPILTVTDGVVAPFEKVRARPKAIARLKQLLAAGRAVTDVAVLHTTSPDEAAALEAYARDRHPDARIFTGRLGPVVGTYTGPGAVGFCMIEGG
jgi:DegV family protein with EDD domain